MSAFQRNKEDFICEHCGLAVSGTGYTNHCPRCLYSKHVDIDPGDRGAACGGLMKPVAIEGIVDSYMITQVCVSCGHMRRNGAQGEDYPESLIALAQQHADVYMKLHSKKK